jgi:hypothetical protein
MRPPRTRCRGILAPNHRTRVARGAGGRAAHTAGQISNALLERLKNEQGSGTRREGPRLTPASARRTTSHTNAAGRLQSPGVSVGRCPMTSSERPRLRQAETSVLPACRCSARSLAVTRSGTASEVLPQTRLNAQARADLKVRPYEPSSRAPPMLDGLRQGLASWRGPVRPGPSSTGCPRRGAATP